jgi:hypothetical protein
MVIAASLLSRAESRQRLNVSPSRVKGKPMPTPDPVPTPEPSPIGPRLKRIALRLAAFSVVMAALGMALVAYGDPEPKLHLLIATGIGVGLTVFLAGLLMSLMFLSSSSGHDDAASHPNDKD